MYCAAGCSGFFKRSIHRNRVYTCKAQGELKGRCPIDKTHRNQCRACRLNKCFQSAMNKDGEFVSKLILYYARFHPLYRYIIYIFSPHASEVFTTQNVCVHFCIMIYNVYYILLCLYYFIHTLLCTFSTIFVSFPKQSVFSQSNCCIPNSYFVGGSLS